MEWKHFKFAMAFILVAVAVAMAVTYCLSLAGCSRKQVEPPNCAAAVLTAEQKVYVNYKQALSKWAYDNGVEIDFDAIDQIYYFPEKHNVDHSGRNKISMYESRK